MEFSVIVTEPHGGNVYTISSRELQVSILDPEQDRDRMGPRYCTGGYVFQIADGGGALLSGPTFPDRFNWFDGQGIPDSFAQGALRSVRSPGSRALIPGIGLCDTSERTVLEHCVWQVDAGEGAVSFATSHAWDEYGFRLERRVSLAGRVVRSETRLSNDGGVPVPIRWFPHPFFPLPAGDDLCSLPGPVVVPEGTTYEVGSSGYLRCSDFGARQAVAVTCAPAGPFTVLQRHPRIGLTAARFSFAAGHVLVWGNENTFSFEPYLEHTVGKGRSFDWSMEYHF